MKAIERPEPNSPALPRIVSRFSCGAASAVATKLVLDEFGSDRDVVVLNAFVAQEHPDNRRFLADCERWFGREIVVLRNEKYGASTVEIFKKRRYMAGRNGAPCTKYLKREVLDAYGRQDDVWVLGYTAEEERRLDAFLDANSGRRVLTPLIDRGLGKADCLAMIERAGLELPAMYRLGYHNANCIGCVKGGEGYWNKIRRDFPEQFEELAAIQDAIGPSAYLFRDRKTGERYSLRQLPPEKGRYQDEPSIECGVMCELVEPDFYVPLTQYNPHPAI